MKKKYVYTILLVAILLSVAAVVLIYYFGNKKDSTSEPPSPAQNKVIPTPSSQKQSSQAAAPETASTPAPAAKASPVAPTVNAPSIISIPVPASSVGISGSTLPESAWRCVSGWNGPIKVENGRISCIGTQSCTTQPSSALCMELANKLNHNGQTLADIRASGMIRKCDLNDAQASPCGYVVGADGSIGAPPPLNPSEWQCLSGFDGPVKYEHGYVYCTGAQGCMPKASADECGITAAKMRKDPVYMKSIEDMGLIRKCPDGSTTEPCIWSESKFTSGANSSSTIIQFPNLYDKAIIWYNPANTATDITKRTYVISRRQDQTTRQEMTETHTVDGKVVHNQTLFGTGNIVIESPYLLKITDDKNFIGSIEIHGSKIYVDLFGKGRVVAAIAASSG